MCFATCVFAHVSDDPLSTIQLLNTFLYRKNESGEEQDPRMSKIPHDF